MGKKIKTSFSIDQENLKWIDKQVETKRFRSRSHVMDYAIEQLKASTPK
jgi:Arc/MetJ-type ribon-helix-helix transcriptional regulator